MQMPSSGGFWRNTAKAIAFVAILPIALVAALVGGLVQSIRGPRFAPPQEFLSGLDELIELCESDGPAFGEIFEMLGAMTLADPELEKLRLEAVFAADPPVQPGAIESLRALRVQVAKTVEGIPA